MHNSHEQAYWDDWLREPPQRQGRHTLRPEVCRTFHFGMHGVSNAQFSEFLTGIKVRAFVRACVRVCVRACVRACVPPATAPLKT